MAKAKQCTHPGPNKLREYFTKQREEHGARGGDTMDKMAQRMDVHQMTIWKTTKGHPVYYDTAILLARETGIAWYEFPIRSGTVVIPYDVLEALGGR